MPHLVSTTESGKTTIESSHLRRLPSLKFSWPFVVEGLDMISITNILHAHHVTHLLVQSLEDSTSVSSTGVAICVEALKTLSWLHFRVIKNSICTDSTLARICFLGLNHSDCFFTALGIIFNVIYLL